VWELAPGEVHCWFFDMASLAQFLPQLRADLTDEERQRAARFAHERNRVQSVVCRAALRRVLAAYGAGPAVDITFEYAAAGKPGLAPHRNPAGLEFNLAHSGQAAVIALARGCPVGVDVELVRPRPDLEGLARTVFSPEEMAEWLSLSECLRVPGFFAGWSRKEAFIKATGEGLSRPLESFSVSLTPGAAPRILRIDDDRDAGTRWTLHDLTRDDAYAAAVALPRPGAVVLSRDLSPAILGLSSG
jgi:4'-phosphopantetheinyl transferase